MLSVIVNARVYKYNLYREIGFSLKNTLYVFEDGVVRYYHDIKQQKLFKNKIYKFILNNPSRVRDYLEEAKSVNKILIKKVRNQERYKEKLEAMPLVELGNEFQKVLVEFQHNFIPCLILPYFVGVAEEEIGFNKNNKIIKEIILTSKQLRLKSHYPEYRNMIIGNILNQIANKSQIEKRIIDVLTPEEIISLLGKKTKFSKDILSERKHIIFYVAGKKEYLIMSKGKYKKIKQILDKNEKRSGQIKGNIGYKGKVIGKTKIIYDSKDFPKFLKGDILVTINSNPSLMPIIRKCSAIISDEGGITSHAAVISREFKIPCIIGTKNATLLLRDGDKVEVDANKGIVRKIKNKSES